MAINGEVFESGRKRARTEEFSSSSSTSSSAAPLAVLVTSSSNKKNKGPTKASASAILRAKTLSNRLSALLKEFPELKFIFDFENLQEHLETAVVKYVEEIEEKKHNAQIFMNYGQDSVPLYSLPDEVLQNCLSFVGKGYYGIVGLTSKKLNQSYKKEFGRETAYLEMATTVNLARYCSNYFCKSLQEKDEILRAAAVNGNLDILRAAVKDGYDLFPLVAMQKKTFYPDSNSDEDDSYCDSDADEEYDVYYVDEDKWPYSWKRKEQVKLSKLVERGHLHVLMYLYEELNYFLGLQRYWKPAIEHGKLEFLEWLNHIGVMDDGDMRIGFMDKGTLKNDFDYCECAIKSGNVGSLEWLLAIGYDITGSNSRVLADAIRSKSTDMIQYCFDLGYNDFNSVLVDGAIRQTGIVEVFRLVHDLGYEFSDIKQWLSYADITADDFEIIKYLRSICVSWDDGIMEEIVKYGTLEMIQYAHEDGCPWTSHGGEYHRLLESRNLSLDKLKYLKDNDCKFDYEYPRLSYMLSDLKAKKELGLLDYFIGKNSSFDNRLFKELFESTNALRGSEPWFEGITYLLGKGKDVQNFKSIEEVFRTRQKIDGIKYFHSLGLPWCLDSSRNTLLLSHIACHNKLEDVKWAYENGCKGGNLVPFVQEEWKELGIRKNALWKTNQAFFEENGLLDDDFLEKIRVKQLDEDNVLEIGDAMLGERKSYFFYTDLSSLKNLVDHGYTFISESVEESVCKEAYKKCCEYSQNEGHRKRFALLVGMGVRVYY